MNSNRHFIKWIILFLLFLPSFSAAQTDYSEWKTVTNTNRVRMRSGPSTRYNVVSLLEQWTSMRVIAEDSGWYNVVVDDGSTGWISNTLVLSKQIVGAINSAPEISETSETTDNTDPGDSVSREEFTSQPEPGEIEENTSQTDRTSFFGLQYSDWNLAFWIPVLLLIFSNIVLLILNRKKQSIPVKASTKGPDFKREFNLLKKSNEDIKKQLRFSTEQADGLTNEVKKLESDLKIQINSYNQIQTEHKKKLATFHDSREEKSENIQEKRNQISQLTKENSDLKKEIESLRIKHSQSQDTLQQQTIKLTLAEQQNIEAVSKLHVQVKSLEEEKKKSADEIKKLYSEVESTEDSINTLKESTEKLQSKLTKLKSEKVELADEMLEKAVKENEELLNKEFEIKIENFLTEHKKELERYKQTTEMSFNTEKERFKSSHETLNHELETVRKELDINMEARHSLEVELEKSRNSVVALQSDDTVKIAFEQMQEKHSTLSQEYETALKKFNSDEKIWHDKEKQYFRQNELFDAEKSELLKQIEQLKSEKEAIKASIEEIKETRIKTEYEPIEELDHDLTAIEESPKEYDEEPEQVDEYVVPEAELEEEQLTIPEAETEKELETIVEVKKKEVPKPVSKKVGEDDSYNQYAKSFFSQIKKI